MHVTTRIRTTNLPIKQLIHFLGKNFSSDEGIFTYIQSKKPLPPMWLNITPMRGRTSLSSISKVFSLYNRKKFPRENFPDFFSNSVDLNLGTTDLCQRMLPIELLRFLLYENCLILNHRAL